MNDLQNRLKSAIEKYKNGAYSESDFQMTLNSIENIITEYDFFELKDFLIGIDASLERINYMVDKVSWKKEYLKIISQIEEFVNKGLRQNENPYNGLREMAFKKTPEQLELSLPSEKTIVYGIVMDWDVRNGTASIISFLTGDASIYFSSGGGIIGGGTHENVKIMAKQFVEKGQQMLDKSLKTEQTPLPDENKVVFYLITNRGIYSGQDKLENFSNQSSIWLGLFLIGNEVINELRSIKEK